MSQLNLYLATRKQTKAREDHLTEFFAATLQECPALRQAYFDHVIAPYVKKRGWTATGIVDVRTQVHGEGGRPDMELTLSDGKIVACEHKLDALETSSPRENKDQLQRYLEQSNDGVVYVRSDWKPPSKMVLDHPKYIRPDNQELFLWRDLYPLLKAHADGHVLVKWLCEGFEQAGFVPAVPGLDIEPGRRMNRAKRREFVKRWGRTRSFAHGLGWRKVDPGSIVELYLRENPSSMASWIFISPSKYERFLFRVTPRDEKLPMIEAALIKTCANLPGKPEPETRKTKRTGRSEIVVDIITSLRNILGEPPTSPEEMENRLLAFVGPLLAAVQEPSVEVKG